MKALHITLALSLFAQWATPLVSAFAAPTSTHTNVFNAAHTYLPFPASVAPTQISGDQDVPPPGNPPYSQIFEQPVHDTIYLPSLASNQALIAQPVIGVRNVWDTDRLTNGQVITGWIVLTATEATTPFSLTLDFPTGLNYELNSFNPGPHRDLQVNYDLATRKLHINKAHANRLIQIVYSYRLIAKASATAQNIKVALTAESLRYPVHTESDVLYIGHRTDAMTLTPAGGDYMLDNGRVRLSFPPGAVAQSTVISAVEYADTIVGPGQVGAAVRFDLYPEMTFRQPVTMQIDLTGLVITSSFQSGQYGRLSYLNRASTSISGTRSTYTTRDEVDGQFDNSTARISAQLTHFSPYEAGVAHSAPKPWKFSASLGEVSLFRGAANFAFGFSAPPMHDGLAPALGIQYSSAAADQDTSEKSQLGSGWSMDLPHISRRTKVDYETYQDRVDQRISGELCDLYGIPKEYDGTCRYFYWREAYRTVARQAEDFTLNLGGAAYQLVHKGSGEYVPQQYAPVRIRRCNAQFPCIGDLVLAEATTSEYWQVWMTDGTRYTFGTVPETEQHMKLGGEQTGQFVSAWYLRHVYAIHRDDPSKIRWSQEWSYASLFHDLAEELRLTKVVYGSSVRPDGSLTTRRFAIYVDYLKRADDHFQPNLLRMTVGVPNAPDQDLIRRYVLDYKGTRTLKAIREEYWNGADHTSLPPVQFDYTKVADTTNLLSKIRNNYGGEVEFTYARLDRSDKKNYRVIAKTTRSEKGWVNYEAYAYSTPCFNEPAAACRQEGHDWSPSYTLMGHAQVTRTLSISINLTGGTGLLTSIVTPLANSVLSVDAQTFATSYQLLGRGLIQRGMSKDGRRILTESTNEYAVYAGTAWDLPAKDGWFAANLTSTMYPAGIDGVRRDIFKRVTTRYDKALQGGVFYGQATGADEYSGAERTKTSVTTFRMLDAARWLLRETSSVVRSADGTRLSEMRYFYTPLGRADMAQFVASVNNIDRTRDISMTFDASGNKTSETIFDDYGWPVDPGSNNRPITQGRAGATTTFSYDHEFGLYPIQWTNPLGHVARAAYYGIDGLTLPILQELPDSGKWRGTLPTQQLVRGAFGQTAYEISPTGAKLTYRYDVFGRLLAATKPELSIATGLPTLEYQYGDATPARGPITSTITGEPFANASMSGVVIVARQRPDSIAFPTYSSAEIYDGLGRVMQTRVITDQTLEGVSAVATSVQFDGAGRAFQQSVSVPSLGALTTYVAPNWDVLPTSVTRFDDLSRAISATGVDGTLTQVAYDGFDVATLDAKGHLSVHRSDALGRLTTVKEYSGTFAAPVFDQPAYATTHYGYDPADRPVVITDTLGHRTIITYNALSQKIGMTDPDMGTWSYDYDARGRLITQTDALNQSITFQYDVLDRVLTKSCLGTRCTASTLARYEYDSAANGIGQRARMTDTTGVTVWAYDLRGRAIRETHTLALPLVPKDGYGDYSVERGYDNLDRPTWVKYPDGEVVTTTYSAQGPVTLETSQPFTQETKLVRDASYNALGQMMTEQLGNGLTTRFGFYGYNAFPSLGQASGLPVNDTQRANFGRLAQTCTAPSAADCATPHTPDQAGLPYSSSYTYDKIGNIASIHDFANAGQTQAFDYDPLNRLISAKTDAAGVGRYNQSWQYDAIGNITQRNTDPATGPESYLYNASKPHAVAAIQNDSGVTPFHASYDAIGNMTERIELSGTTYITYEHTWDAENRLIAVTTDNGHRISQEHYYYNADGERVAQQDSDSMTIFIGELYEETWPLAALGSVPAFTPLQPVKTATNAKAALAPTAINVAAALGPADPTQSYYSLTFAGKSWPITGWDAEDRRVYDCDAQILYNDPPGNAGHTFGWALTPDGVTITGTQATHQSILFNTQPVLPEAGPFVATIHARFGHGNYGATVYFAAFKPDEYAIPVTEALPSVGGQVSWPRSLMSARYLQRAWNAAGTTPFANPICQNWFFTRTSSNVTLGFFENLTPDQFGLVRIYYTPSTNIGTASEQGTITVYGSADTNPAHLGFVRTVTGRDRPRSLILGTATEQKVAAAWDSLTMHALTVTVPVPTIDAIPALTQGTARNLSWHYGGATTSTAFELQRATDTAFATGLNTQTLGSVLSYTVNGLIDGAAYYYRLRALHSIVASPWSNVVSSTQDATAPNFTSFLPASGWQMDHPIVTLTVNDATAGVLASAISYRTDQAGPITSQAYAAVGSTSGTPSSQTASVQMPFNSSGAHQVQFRACDTVGNCADSLVYSVNVDVDAPTISNSQPAGTYAYVSPNSDGRKDTLALSFDASDVGSGVGTWQASIWTADGTTRVKQFAAQSAAPYTFSWDGLADGGALVSDGLYEARVVVTDAAGLRTTANTWPIIILDTTPPQTQPTTLYQPNKGYALIWPAAVTPTVSTNFVLVRGKTSGMDANSVVSMTFNSTPLAISGQNFTATLMPVIGNNAVTAIFEDAAGNQNIVQRSFVYTTSGPTLISVVPTGTVGILRPVISGVFDPSLPVDPLSIIVTVDGVPALGERSATGFVVTPTADLLGGNERPVRVVAEFVGTSGANGRGEWLFNIDTTADIHLTNPISGSLLNQTHQTIVGVTDPFAQVALTVNGALLGTIQADALGHFEFVTTALPVGHLELSANATDTFGHLASDAIALTVDPTAASAALTVLPDPFSPNGDGVRDIALIAPASAPPAGGTISTWEVSVRPPTGTPSGLWPLWTGSLVLPETIVWDGTDATGAALPDGSYDITLAVTATLSNGTQRTSSAQQTVRMDRAVPSAPVILYPSGILSTALPAVGGTGAPGSYVIVRRDGVTVTNVSALVDTAGHWRIDQFPLHMGDNALAAQAQNASGVWSALSAAVIATVPAEPPLISIGIAPDWAGLSQTLMLTATARGQSDPFPATAISAKPREHNPLQTLSQIDPGGSIGTWQASRLADTAWCEAGAYCQDEVIFEGIDTLANRGVATTTLTLDYLPPDAPEIWLPRTRTWVSDTQTLLIGRVFEPFLGVIVQGGASIVTTTAQASGEWQVWVPLSEGQNVLSAVAIDAMGNRSLPGLRAQTLVRRDTLSPVVTSATSALFTRQGVVVPISATVSDAGLVRQALADSSHPQLGAAIPLGEWNDDDATIGLTRTWSRAVGPLSVDGDYTLTYRAADAVGHVGTSAIVRLVVDSVAPQITVTQLIGGFPYAYVVSNTFVYAGDAAATLTPTVMASDNLAGLSSIQIGAAASHAANGALSGSWLDTLTLPIAAKRDVVIQALDRSGNVTTATIQVANDATPPQLRLSAASRTRTGSSMLSIDGADTQSGLRRYDIDLLTDGITVTRIAENQLNPQVSAINLAPGHVYRWRVTATDNVNNVAIANLDVASVATVKTYAFGSQRIAVRAGDQVRWLHGDHLSSVNSMTDASGAVVGRQLYAPYGELRAELGQVDGSWGWATHRKAEANGLTFMRARWYAAGIGRFVQADSMVPAPDQPQAFNRYAYASNSPVQRNDPSGHCDICDSVVNWVKSLFVLSAQQKTEEFKPNVSLLNPAIVPLAATATPQPTATATATAVPTATPQPTIMPVATGATLASSNSEWGSPFGPNSAKIGWGFTDQHDGLDGISSSDPAWNTTTCNSNGCYNSAEDDTKFTEVVPGREVYAVADGNVRAFGDDGTLSSCGDPTCAKQLSGSYVSINHPSINNTLYQIDSYHTTPKSDLKLGQPVKKGDVIGYYSQRGHSTGPHSHTSIFPIVDGNRKLGINPSFIFRK